MTLPSQTIKHLVLIFFFALLPGAVWSLDLQPRFDALARRLLEDRVAVGFVVGVYKDGQTQVVGYGETQKGSGVVPTGDTVYEVGSITKTFTAALLADAMQRGIVKLDAPLQDYLPAAVKVPVLAGQAITLEHLATHTSGFPRRPDNLWSGDRLNPYAAYSEQKMVEFINSYTLRRPPGQYEYSNFAMGLLGHVLALQQGKSYEQLVLERVCAPLGMHDTRHHPTEEMLQRLAPPYDSQLKPVKSWDLGALAGAGGIRSTVNDMLKYVGAHLADDPSQLAQALHLSHARHYTTPDGKGVALAWRMSRNDSILFHGGLTGGYRAWMGLAPGSRVGVVVLANSAHARIYQFGDRLLQLALGDAAAEAPEAVDPE